MKESFASLALVSVIAAIAVFALG
jgi:KDEL-tailed cysteine endopeptidase